MEKPCEYLVLGKRLACLWTKNSLVGIEVWLGGKERIGKRGLLAGYKLVRGL